MSRATNSCFVYLNRQETDERLDRLVATIPPTRQKRSRYRNVLRFWLEQRRETWRDCRQTEGKGYAVYLIAVMNDQLIYVYLKESNLVAAVTFRSVSGRLSSSSHITPTSFWRNWRKCWRKSRLLKENKPHTSHGEVDLFSNTSLVQSPLSNQFQTLFVN